MTFALRRDIALPIHTFIIANHIIHFFFVVSLIVLICIPQHVWVPATAHSHKEVGKIPFFKRCWANPYADWLVIFTDLLTDSDLKQL